MCNQVSRLLTSALPYGTRFEVIKAYNNKTSFGDLDIVVESTHLRSEYVEMLRNLFQTKELVKNGNCVSLEFKQLQIDFIITPASEYETSLNYFSYNDLGNLLGRVSYSMGMKLGHDGLSYNFRDGTYQFRNVILLTDWKDILPVLGYSYERYAAGFDTLEDIFEFVVSSDLFNKGIYALENRNHAARVRDTKRDSYMKFLKWLEGYKETPEQGLAQDWRLHDKKLWLPYLFEKITGFEATYNSVRKEWDEAIKFKSLYNGDLVSSWTGLSGKELGVFMKRMKEEYTEERLKKDVLNINPELLPRWVKHYQDKFDKEN